MNWKVVGLAGVAGVVAGGLVVKKRRREWTEPTADELRQTLQERVREGTTDAAI